MTQGRVIPLGTQHAFGTNTLRRIVAHRGFHNVNRGGYQSDALRILPGTVSKEVLEQLFAVFVDREDAWIAKVVEVRIGLGDECDLLLSPFGEFNQTGPGGPIIEFGVHLLYGPVHDKPEYRPRNDGSYKPLHVLPHLP